MRKLALLFSALSVTAGAQQVAADAIFFHGNILTGVGLVASGPSHPERVTALVVHNGVIAYAGTDVEALKQRTPATKVVDLQGAFVMPGFNDAHTHMAFAGKQRLTVDLDNVPSLTAMQAKVKAYADGLPDGAWITGGGWDHTKWASGTLPTRADLDAVTGAHPAYLERTDGHIAVVNSAALRLAGITRATQAPQGSQIDVDAKGEPTGIVREGRALALVQAVIPKPDAATRRKALTLAIDDALQHGVTSVQDFSEYEDFKVLQAMEHEGKLPIRFSQWMPFDLPVDKLNEYRLSQPTGDGFLHTGMLKGFMDGSLGSRTAAMMTPYSDDPKNSGLPRYDQAKLDALAVERTKGQFQFGFHAIGDRANHMALDAFEAANRSVTGECWKKMAERSDACPVKGSCPVNGTCPMNPSEWLRYRIEHAQVLLPEDFDRFAKMHIIASMQPSHLLTDMVWAGDRLGPERSKYAYAWRSFLDHKVTLAFGTDYPVESVSPFRGLYSAVTRQNEAGTQTFHPEQKLTITEALFAYTQGSAFAEHAEAQKGVLAQYHFADFAVLDRDLLKASPREILNARVLKTVVGGVVRYDANAAKAMLEMRGTHADGD